MPTASDKAGAPTPADFLDWAVEQRVFRLSSIDPETATRLLGEILELIKEQFGEHASEFGDDIESNLELGVDAVCDAYRSEVSEQFGVDQWVVQRAFDEFRIALEGGQLLGIKLKLGLDEPVNDEFDVSYFAHDLGFGANPPPWAQ